MSQDLGISSLLENSKESRESYDEFTYRLNHMDSIKIQGIGFIIDLEENKAIAPNGLRINFSELHGISNGAITNLQDYTQGRGLDSDDFIVEPLDF